MYALFRVKGDSVRQISKAHPHKRTVVVEALERHLANAWSNDFPDTGCFLPTFSLVQGVEIREVEAERQAVDIGG